MSLCTILIYDFQLTFSDSLYWCFKVVAQPTASFCDLTLCALSNMEQASS